MIQPVTQHIASDPEVCGGKPCVFGTRIRVQDIYVWHELQGQTPDEIVTSFPQLTLADVHAALAYYHDHREDIERQMREEVDWAEQMRLKHPSRLIQKLMGHNAESDSIPS